MLWRLFPFSYLSSKLVDNIDLFRGEIIWNCYIGARRNSALFFLCFSLCPFLHNMLLNFAIFRFLLQLIEPINKFLCLLSNWMVMCRRYERFIVTFPVSSVCTESTSFRRMCNGTNMPNIPPIVFLRIGLFSRASSTSFLKLPFKSIL